MAEGPPTANRQRLRLRAAGVNGRGNRHRTTSPPRLAARAPPKALQGRRWLAAGAGPLEAC